MLFLINLLIIILFLFYVNMVGMIFLLEFLIIAIKKFIKKFGNEIKIIYMKYGRYSLININNKNGLNVN